MKKYLYITFWALAVTYLIVVLGFVSKKQDNALCTTIDIMIFDTLEHQFIDRNDVLDLLESEGEQVLGKPIHELNIAQIEKKLNDYPFIKHAEVYKKINGELTIEIKQRIPILRIINSANKSFYIGQEGVLMPISKKVQARLIVVNGNINYYPNFDTITNIYNKTFDTVDDAKILRDVHILVNFINKNEFWRAQMQQVFITEKKEIELTPLVGNHIIQFGNIDRYKEKFRNLEATYKKGFSSEGWNQFKKINLKYQNQVVCSKAE